MLKADTDLHELLRITTDERNIWRAQYHQVRESSRKTALLEARHEFAKIVRELRAHHMDPTENALLDTLEQRYSEMLNLLAPPAAEVKHSAR